MASTLPLIKSGVAERKEREMKKYRKKPVIVEAKQWFKHGDHPDVKEASFEHFMRGIPSDHGLIDTLEGVHIVTPGDWIITGVQGEKYPCKPDIFEETYEPV